RSRRLKEDAVVRATCRDESQFGAEGQVPKYDPFPHLDGEQPAVWADGYPSVPVFFRHGLANERAVFSAVADLPNSELPVLDCASQSPIVPAEPGNMKWCCIID